MQDRINGVLLENPVQQRPVADIAVNHQRTFSADGFHGVQRSVGAVAKIVQHHHFKARFKQRKCGVRTDIPGATRYQNLHRAVHSGVV